MHGEFELATKVVMPRLTLTMKEGTVVQWFKKEGDAVQKGEPLVEVLSEKVTYDVEAPASGVLRKIIASEGANVPTDEAVGIIAGPDESLSETETAITVSSHPVAEVAMVPKEASAEKVEERVVASPAAKRLAREHYVDLSKVRGSGPEGRIVEEDVRHFIGEATVAPRVREIIPLTGIRKTTAERLSLSARTAPHSNLIMEADMTNAAKHRATMQLSYTDILVKAVAKSLREHPIMNATLDVEQIKIFEDVNVGIAVDTSKGLVVPVIRNADKKSLSEIASAVKELVEKARDNKLAKEDMTGGTFTITNLGMYGVDLFIPIINPPETAILAVGKVTEKPVVVNGQVTIKPIMGLTLAYDHRIVDGAPAARFLQKVRQVLESGFES
jgi:pyruvate dehydrogenase E2 component (dihydrolipoamide acetyltransferase)